MRIPSFEQQNQLANHGAPISDGRMIGRSHSAPVDALADSRYIQAQQPGADFVNLGAQLQKLGAEIHVTNVKAQDTEFVGKMQEILYSPEDGYLNTQGIDSKEGYKKAQERFDKAASEARGKLIDWQEKKAFDQSLQHHAQTFNTAIAKHASNQIVHYRHNEAKARLDKYSNMAIANFGTPEFQTYLNTAIAETDTISEVSGHGKEQREAIKLDVSNHVYGNVIANLMNTNKFEPAKKVFDHAREKGLITEANAIKLSKSLTDGFNRETGVRTGDQIYEKRAVGKDFDSAVSFVLSVEGGYVKDDAGKGPTKYGINQTAHPGIDIANLSKAQAVKIYKDKYWKAIGADKLPEEMRAIAFDAAVNQGLDAAKSMVEKAKKSSDSAHALLELRRDAYAKLIAKDPEKYAKYGKSWNARLDQLEAGLDGGTSERSLTALLRQAETLDDPDQKAMAKMHIKQRFNEEKLAKKVEYDSMFETATDIAYQKDGGWKDVPPAIWATLKFEDRQKLISRPKADDPDVVLMLGMNPELTKKGSIERYRHKLSESTYKQLYLKANGTGGDDHVMAASIESAQFEEELRKAGLEKLIGTPKSEANKLEKVQIRATVQQMIDTEQKVKGKKLTLDEKNAIMRKAIAPVKIKAVNWYGGDTTMDQRLYKVQHPSNIIIPSSDKNKIMKDLTSRGIRPTPENVLDMYLVMGR